jgi:hypothetical protein
MTESFNWSKEAERKAALDEVTALRRELKTETAAGAKAAKSDPRFIAAQQRLDAAKSAVGMRTSAQDLAALNRIATRDVATADMTPAERREERQGLNQPSRQYFNQVKEAYKNPDVVPGIKVPKQITPELIKEYAQYGTDASKARFDWVWTEDPKTGKGRWGMGLVGLLKEKPVNLENADQLDIFYSDSAPIAQARKRPSWNAAFNNVNLDELEQALPNISFSQLQEIYYQLTLERDTDITIEDILDKYDNMFGEG